MSEVEPTTVESASAIPAGGRGRGGLAVGLLVAVLAIGGGFYLAGHHGDSDSSAINTENAGAPKVGERAPDFTATTLDGKKVSLSKYQGHPVWLTFGASWCDPCKAEAPDVEATYKKHAPDGLVVLDISISEDAAAVRDYADRVGLTYPIVADPDSQIADLYRVSSIPAHFFIGPDGIVKSTRMGGLGAQQMEDRVAELKP